MRTPHSAQLISGADLEGLEGLAEDTLREAFDFYLPLARRLERSTPVPVALAAALIEVGLTQQGLGGAACSASDLLVTDLALARAARLLAAGADRELLIGIAGVIERTSAAAASGMALPGLRGALSRVIEAGT